MDQASFLGFLKTLVIIVLIYYFIKFAFRLLAPYLLSKAVNKVNENFQKKQQAYYQNQQNSSNSNQGFEENMKQNQIPKEKKKVGEYIDFEEVE